MRLLVDSLLDDEQFDAKKTRDYLQLIARREIKFLSTDDPGGRQVHLQRAVGGFQHKVAG